MTSPIATDRFDDNTRISAYKDCPRKFFYRHVMDWRSEGTAVTLAFGGSWHAAMDVVWKYAKRASQSELVDAAMGGFIAKWEEEGFSAQLDAEQTQVYSPRTPGIANEMLYHYIRERWAMLQECEVVAIEQPFAVPLPNLDRSWYVGRLDKVVRHGNNFPILEHKTTALYSKASNFQPSYVDSWYVDSQVKGYQFGGSLYYPGLTGVWVDAALVHKQIHEAFKFIPVQHSFPLIKEWLNDTQSWVESMVRDENTFAQHGELVPGCFRKNENSCFGKYGACSYLNICRTTANVRATDDPPFGYIEEKWSPFETLGLDKIIEGSGE